MALRWPPAWPSVTWPGWFPGGERDDAAGAHVAGLLGFQGELVDCADEGGDVGTELGELLVLGGDRLPEPGDGGAEPGLVAIVSAALPDALVELVFQVGVALGERGAGQRAAGPFGRACQDALHRGADLAALVGCGGHPASLPAVIRVRSWL